MRHIVIFVLMSIPLYGYAGIAVYHDSEGNTLLYSVDNLKDEIEFEGKVYKISPAYKTMKKNSDEYKRDRLLAASKPDVKIGMNSHTVILDTKWGVPTKKNITKTVKGTSEEWVYDGLGLLYFENEKLVKIKTAE